MNAAPPEPRVITGAGPEAVSPQTRELFAWADECVRKGIQVYNEALARIVTLSAALLAGSAALLGQMPASPWSKAIAALLLMASLGVSLWGGLPREAHIDTNNSRAIEQERQRGLTVKARCLKTASACLFLAFAFLLAGLLFPG